jgi:hypothetical protein
MTAREIIWDPKKGDALQGDHAITLKAFNPQPTQLHDAALARQLHTEPSAPVTTGTARLFRDNDALHQLLAAQQLTTDRLAISLRQGDRLL